MDQETSITIKAGIINQLLYSEVFEHPLTPEELLRFSPVKEKCTPEKINAAIQELESDNLVRSNGTYISIFEQNGKIEKRETGAQRANQLFEKAVRVASFIQKFPFVEGVGISGSLSKGILHDDGDFDFFIITKPDRVWVARTMLILYKKIFLLNSRKYFCVNYFIDSDHLEIEEKNRFTAVEVSTLIPAAGEIFEQFYHQNRWVTDYFPNGARTSFETKTIRKPGFSRFLQKILGGKLGHMADKRAMKITLNRWKRKFSDFDHDKFDLTMKSRRYVSKHHPNDFQNKVLGKFDCLKAEFINAYGDTLKNQNIKL